MKEIIREAIDIFETLPFLGTTSIVAAISGIVTFGANHHALSRFKWQIILIIPFVIAYSAYWSPVWMGADPSEYSVWAPLFIVPWYLAGAALSALLSLLIGRLRRVSSQQITGRHER